MPIYEYECDGCHSVFEVRQKVSDPAPRTHACGSNQVRRILSATSFVLKGTGWYATDYGNRKADSSAGDNKKTAPASDAQDKKIEAKPAQEGASKGSEGKAADQAPSKAASQASTAAKPQSS